MKHIKLRDLDVSRIGLGAMPMSAFYTGAGTDEAESIRTGASGPGPAAGPGR